MLGRPSLSPRRPIHKMAKAARWISLERHGGESPMSSYKELEIARYPIKSGQNITSSTAQGGGGSFKIGNL